MQAHRYATPIEMPLSGSLAVLREEPRLVRYGYFFVGVPICNIME